MITQFLKGFTSYGRALAFISKHGLYGHFITSGVISLIIGAVIVYTGYAISDDIAGYLSSWYPFEWGSGVMEKITTTLSGLLIIVLGFWIFKYILLICISPFMGPLSSKVEVITKPNTAGSVFSLAQMSYEMIRGVRIASRNVVREILLTILILLLGLIPLFSIPATILLVLVQAYYLGFAHFDYFLERRASVPESVTYVRAHRWQAIGNGSGFLLLLLLPILGLFLAPVLGTVSATLVALDNEDYE